MVNATNSIIVYFSKMTMEGVHVDPADSFTINNYYIICIQE